MHYYILLFLLLAVLLLVLIFCRKKTVTLSFQNNVTDTLLSEEEDLLLAAEDDFEAHVLKIINQYFSGNLSPEHKLDLSSLINQRRYNLQTSINSLHIAEATTELLQQLQYLRNSLNTSPKKGNKRQRKKAAKKQMQRVPEELISMMDTAICRENPLMFFRLLYREDVTYFEYLYSILTPSIDERITRLAVKYENLTREIQMHNALKNELEKLNKFIADHAVELQSYH